MNDVLFALVAGAPSLLIAGLAIWALARMLQRRVARRNAAWDEARDDLAPLGDAMRASVVQFGLPPESTAPPRPADAPSVALAEQPSEPFEPFTGLVPDTDTDTDTDADSPNDATPRR